MTTVTYDIDVLLKKLGITRTASIDVLLEKLEVAKTGSIDVRLWSNAHPYWEYSIDATFAKLGISTNDIDILIRRIGIKKTDSIDTLLKKLGITKTDSIDVLIKKLEITVTSSIDVILQALNPPTPAPDVPETLLITDGVNTLWARPISWKENQSCNPAIRPLPLGESEHLDADTWVLKPRTIELKIRLSDREKDTFETIYNYPSTLPSRLTTAINNYVDFYLLYDNPQYTWHYLVWIREKSYKFTYEYQNNRYVRWWTATLTCDVQAFAGSSSVLPTWDDDSGSPTYGYTTYLEDVNWAIYNSPYYDPIAKAVMIGDERLNHILDFSRDDEHPPMIPNWVNQLAEVDSYIWNECVLDTFYTCRMTNAEKYHMDLLLQAHQKIIYEDFIHNIFAPASVTHPSQTVPDYGAWITSVEAQWDSANWIKPWKVTIALKANNSETESRTATVTVTSMDETGTMYLDEVTTALTLPYVDDEKVGIHMLYFFQPAGSIWDYWTITGDAIKILSQGDNANGIGGEHILTVLIYGDCTIQAVFHYLAITLDSYLDTDPLSRSEGLITVDDTDYSLPYNLYGSVIATPYTLEFSLDPCVTTDVFDHWESSANITIDDPNSDTTTFTLDSGITGTITAVYKADYQIDIDYGGYSNPCNPAKITVDGIQYTCPDTIYEFFGDWTTSATAGSGDNSHVFDHWETTGGISVDDIYATPTTIHVTANGTLTAVFHTVVWEFITNHPSDPNQGQLGILTDIGMPWENLPQGPYNAYTVDSLYAEDLHWRANGNGGTFSHWSFTGGIHIADVNSANTTFWVSDSFTLTANYT